MELEITMILWPQRFSYPDEPIIPTMSKGRRGTVFAEAYNPEEDVEEDTKANGSERVTEVSFLLSGGASKVGRPTTEIAGTSQGATPLQDTRPRSTQWGDHCVFCLSLLYWLTFTWPRSILLKVEPISILCSLLSFVWVFSISGYV